MSSRSIVSGNLAADIKATVSISSHFSRAAIPPERRMSSAFLRCVHDPQFARSCTTQLWPVLDDSFYGERRTYQPPCRVCSNEIIIGQNVPTHETKHTSARADRREARTNVSNLNLVCYLVL